MTKTNDDVELSDEIIDRSTTVAVEIVNNIFDKENPDYDPSAVMFSLFVGALQHLHYAGWTTQELVNEVFNHTEHNYILEETLQ